jgi:hypothetical protein
MNLNDDIVYRCLRPGPLHQRHPGRSRSLIRHHNRFHLGHLSASRLILPALSRKQIEGAAGAQLSLDGLTRQLIRRSLSYRFTLPEDAATAPAVERQIQREGLVGQPPLLNPTCLLAPVDEQDGPMTEGCVLCDHDRMREADLYFENELCSYASTRDPRDPPDVIPGCGVIVSKIHRASVVDLTAGEWAATRGPARSGWELTRPGQSRHEVTTLREDPVPRVRAATGRVIVVLTAAGS